MVKILDRHRCHMIVQADRITKVEREGDNIHLYFPKHALVSLQVPSEAFVNKSPEVGDYLILSEDGQFMGVVSEQTFSENYSREAGLTDDQTA